jgi:hypothetical protein
MGWFVAIGIIAGVALLGWLAWWSSGRAAPAPRGRRNEPPDMRDGGSGMAGWG